MAAKPLVLSQGKLDPERYEAGWQELASGFSQPTPDYLTYHKRRFFELFDHLAGYIELNPSARVLEIGASAFSKLYKFFFPQIHLVTIDRPIALLGVDASFARAEWGADAHYNLDLNQEAIGPQVGDPPMGEFDYVVFTEILEHLTVNPLQIFGEVLNLLTPNGVLYLTTPNYFAYYRVLQLAAFDNPQAFFARRGEDLSAGYHFREYTMLELIDLLAQAGGKIVKAYFSDCWDDPAAHERLDRTPQYRADLLVIACRQEAEITCGAEIEQWREYAKPEGLVFAPDSPMQHELTRLRRQVAGYEKGRLMRLMKWLHQRGVPGF